MPSTARQTLFARIGVTEFLGEYIFRDLDIRSAGKTTKEIAESFLEWTRDKSGSLVVCQDGIGRDIADKLAAGSNGRTVQSVRLSVYMPGDKTFANMKALAYSTIEGLLTHRGIHFLTQNHREEMDEYFASNVVTLTTDNRIRYEKSRIGNLTILALTVAAHLQRNPSQQ
ncbi:hypothetical protein O3W44_22490 [Pantoea sp. LMR881]|uniref:hypothetical protein n=1 Tax=Pantoea sp. LMR881 TaxID=3014336 RepID=UPI0022AEC7B8|nr:hypothetical protein [Pantoea sp. LMR881]MCZ4061192.1 hypothetical protein [Pantoea sp. LMR881]MCZ4061303.1 hypothetical protein [Pantoea sp. LMR881]